MAAMEAALGRATVTVSEVSGSSGEGGREGGGILKVSGSGDEGGGEGGGGKGGGCAPLLTIIVLIEVWFATVRN